MPRYVYNKKKDKYKKVADYDTTLMMTLKDVIPNDPKLAKEFLVKKDDAPEGKLRDFYHTKDNSGLVRKIFTTFLKAVLIEVAVGSCQFIVPLRGRTNPSIYVGELNDKVVKTKRKQGRLNNINLLQTDYTVPYLHYKMSPTTSRQDLLIYVNKSIYNRMINHANKGGKFSKLPKKLDYFLPYIYDEFSYIKEQQLEKLLKHCFTRLQWHIKRGEEIRIIDNDGEIRFFRPLGKAHDKVMRKVVRQRLTRERKQRYGSIS